MNGENLTLIFSEEGKKQVEYIQGIEKRFDKLVAIVPSEEDLYNDPFGIDDAFEAYEETKNEVYNLLVGIFTSQEDPLEVIQNCYDKTLKVEKNCREKVIVYLKYAIDELIEQIIVNFELKKDYRVTLKKYDEIAERYGEKLSEEYISELDECVDEFFECYDQFLTFKIQKDEELEKERKKREEERAKEQKEKKEVRKNQIILAILAAAFGSIGTFIVTVLLQYFGILKP